MVKLFRCRICGDERAWPVSMDAGLSHFNGSAIEPRLPKPKTPPTADASEAPKMTRKEAFALANRVRWERWRAARESGAPKSSG
jgi:hypothetical protein